MTPRRRIALAVALAAMTPACSQSDRRDTNASVDAAASAAAAAAHAVASDAARTLAGARPAGASVKHLAGGAVAEIRSGAARAERAIDGATRTAAPPARNYARATAVKARLVAIDAVSGIDTNVVAAGETVRLSGKVASAAIASRFEAAALTVPGVRHVAAHLTVDAHLPNPVQPARDLALGASVRASLAAVGGLAAADLDVEARDGAVTLAGTVANAALRARLETAARDTPGVERLDDTLTLQ